MAPVNGTGGDGAPWRCGNPTLPPFNVGPQRWEEAALGRRLRSARAFACRSASQQRVEWRRWGIRQRSVAAARLRLGDVFYVRRSPAHCAFVSGCRWRTGRLARPRRPARWLAVPAGARLPHGDSPRTTAAGGEAMEMSAACRSRWLASKWAPSWSAAVRCCRHQDDQRLDAGGDRSSGTMKRFVARHFTASCHPRRQLPPAARRGGCQRQMRLRGPPPASDARGSCAATHLRASDPCPP